MNVRSAILALLLVFAWLASPAHAREGLGHSGTLRREAGLSSHSCVGQAWSVPVWRASFPSMRVAALDGDSENLVVGPAGEVAATVVVSAGTPVYLSPASRRGALPVYLLCCVFRL